MSAGPSAAAVGLEGGRAIPVAPPDATTFAAHVAAGRPLVIAPDGDEPLLPALPELADRSRARARLAGMLVQARNGSASELVLGLTAGETAALRYAELEDHLDADPATQLVCSEHPTPEPLAGLVPVPGFADVGPADDRHSDMFLAGPAAVAHLHYDGDLRDVLMVQLHGRKRYVLIDPARSGRVLPLTEEGVQRTSGVFVEHLDATEAAAFLAYTDAWECVLEPGQALLMPAGWWHYVEYLEVSLSVNHRLGRNPYLRTLAEQVPVPSVEWLALAQAYRDEAAVDAVRTCAWHALERGLAVGDHDEPVRRAARLERLCLELCGDLGLAVAEPPTTVVDLERRARVMAAPAPEPAEARRSPAAPPPAGAAGAAARSPATPSPANEVPVPAETAPADTDPPETGAAADTAARVGAAPAAATVWTVDTRVVLPEGAQLLVPLGAQGLTLAIGDRLIAVLPPDAAHPWTLPVLALVARRPGQSVAELARITGAAPDHVIAFLTGMEQAGWVAAAPA